MTKIASPCFESTVGFVSWIVFVLGFVISMMAANTHGDESDAARRLFDNKQFFVQAQQPTGLLIPLYYYPANVHTNEVFNRLMDLKKNSETHRSSCLDAKINFIERLFVSRSFYFNTILFYRPN